MTVLYSLDLYEARYFVRPDLVPNCLQMTTVDTSGKIGRSIMTLELLESPELDYIHFGVFTGADPGFLERVFICIKAQGSLF